MFLHFGNLRLAKVTYGNGLKKKQKRSMLCPFHFWNTEHLGKPMKIYEKSMKTWENLWKSMKNLWKHGKTHENLWKPLKIYILKFSSLNIGSIGLRADPGHAHVRLFHTSLQKSKAALLVPLLKWWKKTIENEPHQKSMFKKIWASNTFHNSSFPSIWCSPTSVLKTSFPTPHCPLNFPGHSAAT